jgi:hypothetical protein
MGTLFEEQLYICAPGGGAAAVPAVARVGSGKSAGPDNGSRTGCTVAQHERGSGDGDRRPYVCVWNWHFARMVAPAP